MTEERLREIELCLTRHPYVAGSAVAELVAEIRRCWDRIKLQRTKISELMDEDETP